MQLINTGSNAVRSAWRLNWKGTRTTFTINATESDSRYRGELACALLEVRGKARAFIQQQAAIKKEREPKTVLEKIERAHVFDAEVTGSILTLTEGCDYYYDVRLTKSEARQLVTELTALIDTMEGEA